MSENSLKIPNLFGLFGMGGQKRSKAVVKHYHAGKRVGETALHAAFALSKELFLFRAHIGTIFSNQFKNVYRDTVLGVFWSIFLPIVPITVYMLLVNLRVFPAYDGISRDVYIGFNVTMWALFSQLILGPISVVRSKNAYSMKTALPLSVSIAASFTQLSYDTMVRLAFLLILVVSYSQWPQPHFGWFLLTVFTGIMFSLALGLIFSIFSIIYPDVEKIIGIIMRYAIFLSGVIFPLDKLGALAFLEDWNPMAVFVNGSRDALFLGKIENPDALFAWACVAILIFLIALRFFYIMEHRIREVA